MSTTTDLGPDAVVEITVKDPATTKIERKGTFLSWLRRTGERIRAGFAAARTWTTRMLRRGYAATKTAGATAVNWLRSGANSLGRGATYLGNRIYHGGAATGRFLGRSARFFGRSAAMLARGTSRFLVRATGWVLRSASWTVRTVLETVFAVSLAAWLVIGVVTVLLAVTHDKYESGVHRHARAMSVGEYRESGDGAFGPISARDVVAEAVGAMEQTAAPRATAHREGDSEPTRWNARKSIEDPVDFYLTKQTPDFDGEVPLDEIGEEDLLGLLIMMDHFFIIPPMANDPKRIEDPRIMALTDNQLFQAKSYWEGRRTGFDALMGTWRLLRQPHLKTWDEISNDMADTGHKTWAILNKDSKPRFDARELHRNSYKRGFDHSVELALKYYHDAWVEERGFYGVPVEEHATV